MLLHFIQTWLCRVGAFHNDEMEAQTSNFEPAGPSFQHPLDHNQMNDSLQIANQIEPNE